MCSPAKTNPVPQASKKAPPPPEQLAQAVVTNNEMEDPTKKKKKGLQGMQIHDSTSSPLTVRSHLNVP